MRFYFIVLITPTTFMAMCDRSNGSKVTTTPLSSMNPADVNQTTVAAERMRLAVNGTADKIEEERMFPSSSTVEAVHAIESKWRRKPTAFPMGESRELERAKELIEELSITIKDEHSRKNVQTVFYEHSQYYDAASIMYALGRLKELHSNGHDRGVARQFYDLYLQGFINQGYDPLQVLLQINKKWVPSRSVLSNLKEYIWLYNLRVGSRTKMFVTLKNYLGTDYDLALVMSHLKRHGEVDESLYRRLAAYYAENYQPDDLFELLRPKNGESEWNFEMLYYVFGQKVDPLLQFLVRKFGGTHELTAILARADESDTVSKILSFELRKLAMSL